MRRVLMLVALLALSACGAQPIDEKKDQPGYSGFSSRQEADQPIGEGTYSRDEMLKEAQNFFGNTSQGLAQAVEKAFADYGRPNAYIAGDEGGGAFFVGLRYGRGELRYKGGGSMPVYWQGPSLGLDWGGNASKVFTLVYNLHSTYQLFQRFPSVDGSLYVVAGVGLNYQRSGDITLAPIRTGVGLRAGASLGYIDYTRESTINPF
ncbi:MAG TPA: DUF1134 domain-containing protein [Nevskiaceae bacterium]|nr:DUF1134 domain-containing protein [Nevskiaceae bacterium]